MQRYIQGPSVSASQRYSLAVTPVSAHPELAGIIESPLAPEQCQALASYQRPVSRIACCPIPSPIAPSDATEWVL
jgi:hypothetical protein